MFLVVDKQGELGIRRFVGNFDFSANVLSDLAATAFLFVVPKHSCIPSLTGSLFPIVK